MMMTMAMMMMAMAMAMVMDDGDDDDGGGDDDGHDPLRHKEDGCVRQSPRQAPPQRRQLQPAAVLRREPSAHSVRMLLRPGELHTAGNTAVGASCRC